MGKEMAGSSAIEVDKRIGIYARGYNPTTDLNSQENSRRHASPLEYHKSIQGSELLKIIRPWRGLTGQYRMSGYQCQR